MIKTSEPILRDRDKITAKIARFWDQLSEGWQIVWGPHIHHGYYENNQTIVREKAQEKLIIKLTDLLDIPPAAEILDVGCGMGGSSIYLAEKYHAKVTGITLSPKQVQIAENHARKMNIQHVTFKVEDALSLSSFANNSMDIIWSLESCEQFYDKALFIKQASRVLKPKGKLMLATWCSNCAEYQDIPAKNYRKLCFAFDVPYMPTMEYYRSLLLQHHFLLNESFDWSMYVKKSWEVGLSLLEAYSFMKLLKLGGLRGLRFAKQIKLMHAAFQQKQIQYGVFIATKR